MYIIPCPTIQKASEILRNPKIFGQHTIIIHTEVNNVEYNSPEDIAENAADLLLFCKETYPSTKVVISSITPRKYELNTAVKKKTNELIRKELDTDQLQDVLFIDNSNLDDKDFLHDVKHLKKNNGVKILASNIKKTVRPYKTREIRKTTHGSRLTQERPKVIDRTLDKQPIKAATANTMMGQVLELLKQMNNLIINNRPQLQPPRLPFYWSMVQKLY